MTEIIAQVLSIVGLIIIVLSFQCKKNSLFFLMQGLGSLVFFIHFIMISAYGGALFNLTNLLRGLLFMKDPQKKWKLAAVETAYTACFAFSVYMNHGLWDIVLVALPFSALLICSVLMWLGNAKHIRYFQIAYMSPAWIVHNIFNFSLGGLICECFNMVSSIISCLRTRKEKM